MISTRPMIPMLTHVDNLGDLNIDMTPQEQSLETIANNTGNTTTKLNDIEHVLIDTINTTTNIQIDTASIREASTNTAKSVGTTADADTATTVIGLLKSIANKLS